MEVMGEKAIVLFSGGIDSTTALHWGKKHFTQVQALVFSYSQRHSIEVKMAGKIAAFQNIPCTIVEFPLKGLVSSALIGRDREIPRSDDRPRGKGSIPVTYVPFRNGIFLAVAAAVAESRNIFHLITGFHVLDSPDYPDTTGAFTRKMEAAINQGTSAFQTGQKFRIHAPFLKKKKKEIIARGLRMGADYSFSISCYRGEEIPCLNCPACVIRSQAFSQLNLEDPLVIRLKKEGRI